MKEKIEMWVESSVIGKDGKLTLETRLKDNSANELSEQLSKQMIDTNEEAVRQGLIKMGWTPPKEQQK